uniref:CEBPZ opposite strand n=1 Tax=Oryzias latipes TaxID=8090 RepID=A0A3P9LMM0_ORYLA
MSPRPLEPLAKRLLKGVIALELAGVFGAYALFHKMNNSQESKNRFVPPPVYYQSNEWAGIYGIRERDHQAWSAKQE